MGVYETLSHVSAYEILAGLGALFELVGFVWVVAGVSRSLSEDYGEAGVFRRIGRGIVVWLKYVFEEPRKVFEESVTVSAGGTIHATGSARAVAHGLETDIERLQRELRELRADVERQRERVEQRFSAVDQRVSAVEASVRESTEQLLARAEQIENRLREIHRTGLRKEKGGALVFGLGALLTLVAALT
jgi:hypothetical protein